MSNGHKYWANAFGTVGFFCAIAFMVSTCNDLAIEKEKTKQLKFQHQTAPINTSNNL